ncbi:MAG: ComEC/Rec2 family competence protein [Cruoricaptor ignavus]|nr:ComEC/Rec2 family competence protein [Cruoricaptor ignavus]
MYKQPLLICCISLILGIVFQDKLDFGENTVFFPIIVLAILLFSLVYKHVFISKIRAFLVPLFFFGIGVFLHFKNSEIPNFPDFDKRETAVFKLTKKLNSNEKNRRYEVVTWIKESTFPMVLSVPKSEPELDFSHYYKSEISLNKLQSPENDFQFDYARFLSRQNIHYQGFVYDEIQLSERENWSFFEQLKHQRFAILKKINEANLSPNVKEFMKGIILADRTEMDAEVIANFQKSGLAHILAISGTHIGIIFGVFYFVFIKAFPLRFSRFSVIFSLVFIWGFAVFIGLGNSVVRACIMLSAYFGFRLLHRKTDTLHAMALAAMLILLVDTQQFFNVGFQLSFVAVLGIFWLNKPIQKYLPKPRNKYQDFFVGLVSVTLAAQISTLPLVVYYFNQFSLLSFFANLVVLPLAQIVIVSSLFMVVFIGFGFPVFLSVYDIFIRVILYVIAWFASLDFGFSDRLTLSFSELCLVFVAIYYLRFFLLKPNLKHKLNFISIVLIFIILRLSSDFYYHQKNEVLTHQFSGKKVFSIKQKSKVYFWIEDSVEMDKLEKYLIKPYLINRRAKDYEIFPLPSESGVVEWEGKQYIFD